MFDINNQVGRVTCDYGDVNLEFIFNPEINDNRDGYHILDYFAALLQRNEDPTYKNVNIVGMVEDTPFLEKFSEILEGKENWIITFFRTEKILGKHDIPDDWWVGDVETKLKSLQKHKILTDNLFIKDDTRIIYPNLYFTFTNSIYQWNEIISIRWYYEFKQVYEKLSFDYDLIYSVRNHKKHRVEILKGLNEYNHPKILLQRTDTLKNAAFNKYNSEISSMENVYFNKIEGYDDFSNLTNIEYHHGINWDIFFRFLSKAKVQVLDESWSWSKSDFNSHYLSEKTIGLVLAGIPFVSTHSYPLEILQQILDIEPHPFFDDFKNHKGDSKLFVKFIKTFMENFDENYEKCKTWSVMCHEKFMDKLNKENTLIDLILDGFENENKKIKKSYRLL